MWLFTELNFSNEIFLVIIVSLIFMKFYFRFPVISVNFILFTEYCSFKSSISSLFFVDFGSNIIKKMYKLKLIMKQFFIEIKSNKKVNEL